MARRLPAKVLALLAFCCALFACSAEGPSAHEEGSIALGLTLPPGVQIDQVTLRILRDGEGVLLLTIPVDALGATASAFAQLPAGTGYVAELEARSVDGTTSCVGSEPFEVVASQTTSLTIPLACRLLLPNTGGIIVGVSFNSCPVVSSVVAAPAQVPVGASLQLYAVASDPNGDPLSLRWVATSGELAFGNALGATNTLVCTEPGPSTVTFVATDGACETRLSVSVSCSPGTCGDGLRTADEECDDGNVASGDGCDSQCRREVCGNGRVDLGEQCDPPGLAGCDSSCQLVRPCDLCSEPACSSQQCEALSGTAVAGPREGALRSLLCESLMECVHRTSCATSSTLVECYCGGAGLTDCLNGGPHGPCQAEMEAAAESTVIATVLNSVTSTTLASGAAFRLMRCEFARCYSQCIAPVCGDGVLGYLEQCDDGNTLAGDGCSASCQYERRCGDGQLDTGEQCDDGNTLAGDGCSVSCQLEPELCGTCQATHCAALAQACFDAPTIVASGPGAGQTEAQLCSDVMACARVTGCARGELADCYCGALSLSECITRTPAGPCRAELEAAASSSFPQTVGARYLDPRYASGRAMQLLRCESEHCAAECP